MFTAFECSLNGIIFSIYFSSFDYLEGFIFLSYWGITVLINICSSIADTFFHLFLSAASYPILSAPSYPIISARASYHSYSYSYSYSYSSPIDPSKGPAPVIAAIILCSSNLIITRIFVLHISIGLLIISLLFVHPFPLHSFSGANPLFNNCSPSIIPSFPLSFTDSFVSMIASMSLSPFLLVTDNPIDFGHTIFCVIGPVSIIVRVVVVLGISSFSLSSLIILYFLSKKPIIIALLCSTVPLPKHCYSELLFGYRAITDCNAANYLQFLMLLRNALSMLITFALLSVDLYLFSSFFNS